MVTLKCKSADIPYKSPSYGGEYRLGTLWRLWGNYGEGTKGFF